MWEYNNNPFLDQLRGNKMYHHNQQISAKGINMYWPWHGFSECSWAHLLRQKMLGSAENFSHWFSACDSSLVLVMTFNPPPSSHPWPLPFWCAARSPGCCRSPGGASWSCRSSCPPAPPACCSRCCSGCPCWPRCWGWSGCCPGCSSYSWPPRCPARERAHTCMKTWFHSRVMEWCTDENIHLCLSW